MPLIIADEPRLELRLLDRGDLADLVAVMMQNHEFLSVWLPDVARIANSDGVAAWLNRRIAACDDGDGGYAGIWLQTKLVGVVGLHNLDITKRSASVGCWLSEDTQGQGVMTRAAAALVRHGFHDLGLNRLEWDCPAANVHSTQLAERLGFTLEGTMREAQLHDGELVDKVVYGLLAREFTSATAG